MSTRNSELAQIHIAKKQLGLDEDTYRQMLWTIGRVESSADLDFAGRCRVLEHLKSRGWKPRPPTKAKSERKLADEPQHKKIRAMWLELHAQGAVFDPSEKAIQRFCKNQVKVDRLEWLTVNQAIQLIETLKSWMARAEKKREKERASND